MPDASSHPPASHPPAGRPPTLAVWGARVALAVAAVACAATLAFALLTLESRPLDGTEGHLLFDASRIRAHLPLYVDPLQGAWDYGPVPSRYYVLHAPLWAWVLSLLPEQAAPALARALTTGAWFGLLAGTALVAPRGQRTAASFAALFVAGAYPLSLFAAAGRHDAPALLLAGVALLRSMRRGRVGPLEGALFALAAFVKPNVIGCAAGALACDVVVRRWRAWPAILTAGAVAAACALGLHWVSDGAWIEHLLRSTQTIPIASLWVDQMRSRLPFFALPLLAAAWWAWRARALPAARLALWALAASSTWTVWSLSKVGSASNYWMEPCFVAVAIASRVPAPPLRRGAPILAAVAAVVQSLWVGVAAVRSSLDGIAEAPRKRAAILAARAACGAAGDDVLLADETGLEMMLDGRVIQVPFIVTHLVRSGRYPLGQWLDDLRRPQIRGLVMQSDLLERPLEEVDVADDLFDPAMRRALRDRFALVRSQDGVWVYGVRR